MQTTNWKDKTSAKVDNRRARGSSCPIPSPVPRKEIPVQAFYDSSKKTFWVFNSRGELMDVTESSLSRLLRSKGLSKSEFRGDGLNQIDGALLDIQQEMDVHFAGPLSGYPVGLTVSNGQRVLVTRGPTLIKPSSGKFPTLDKYIRELFEDQVVYVLGWLKCGLASLRAGPPFRPGQMLSIAGPAGCGKSLFQSIITEFFGGRVAKPYRYLIGETSFNAELFGAEHLSIEDEAASTDLRTRRHFGSQLKNLIVNEVQSFHGKGRQAVGLTPFWRVSVTLNDETENLMVLPPLDESLQDKILLLKASVPNFPFGSESLDERRKFREKLSEELPAFCDWLHNWRLPDRLKNQRYGVKSYQHPELLRELDSLAPEFRLLSLIDSSDIWLSEVKCWVGSSLQLENSLRSWDRGGESSRVFSFATSCGVYLGRLARKFPERFISERGPNNSTLWTILRKA